MSLPLVTGVAPRWESHLATAVARSRRVHVVRRCADVAELVGVAAAGLARVAVVSSDLRGLDRSVLDALREAGTLVLAVHPPGDTDAARALRRWGAQVVAPADLGADGVEEALAELIDPQSAPEPPPAGQDDAGRSALRVPDGTAPRRVGQHGERRAGPPDADDRGPAEVEDPTPSQADRAPTQDRPVGPVDEDEGAEGEGRGAAAQGHADLDHGDDEPASPAPAHEGPGREGPGRLAVVWGPHGSPGRTTVAVNFAAELAGPLDPVVLVDADTYAASVAQLLAILDEAPGLLAAARAADQGRLDGQTLARLAPEVRPGLRVLTGLPRSDRWPELREAALADVLEVCREVAAWTVVDISPELEQDEELSFDTSAPRRNGAALTALEQADVVVVVGSGDPVGLQRLVRALDVLPEHTVATRHVVVNRVRSGPVGPEPGRRIREALHRFAGADAVHLVPDDRDTLDATLLHGRLLEEVRPTSPARRALAELAEQLAGGRPHRRNTRSATPRSWLGLRRRGHG